MKSRGERSLATGVGKNRMRRKSRRGTSWGRGEEVGSK